MHRNTSRREDDGHSQTWEDDALSIRPPHSSRGHYNRVVRSPTPTSCDEDNLHHEVSLRSSLQPNRFCLPSPPEQQAHMNHEGDESSPSRIQHCQRSHALRADDNTENNRDSSSVRRHRRTAEKGSGSRGRLVLRDFTLLEATVLKDAIGHYRCQICTLNPFPNDIEEQQMAIDAWRKACEAKKVSLQCTEEIIAVVSVTVTVLVNIC